VLEAGEDKEEMIPFFSIASREFDKDLDILKKVLHQFEQMTHSENAYKLSERATLACFSLTLASHILHVKLSRFNIDRRQFTYFVFLIYPPRASSAAPECIRAPCWSPPCNALIPCSKCIFAD
jgi:hypothetical protein